MKPKPPIPTAAAALRRHAEGRLRAQQRNQKSAVPGQRLAADAKRTLHELQVHQIELEMQNTELQEARDRLDAQLEKYTDLYDFAPAGYFSLDKKGVIQEVNLTGAALLGVERSRLINGRFARFVTPASQPDFLAFLKRVFVETGQEVCDLAMVKEDDAAMWARLRGTVAVSAGDSRKWCRVSVADITAFQHADEARARLVAIVESSDDAIIGKDLHGIITSWNRAAERLFGYTEAEAVGQPVTMLIPADLRMEETRILEIIRRGEAVSHYETTRRRKDGTPVEVSLTVSPVKNARGEIVGASKIARDITERKRSVAELQRVSVLLDTLLHTAPIGFCFLDRDLRFVRINARLAQINGFSVEAHLGRHVSEIVPALVDSLGDVTGRILATGEAVLNHEFSGETPAAPGWMRTWSESWYPVRDNAGEVLGFGGIVEEVTARKQAEEQIHRLNAELDQRVVERTAALGLEIAAHREAEERVGQLNGQFTARVAELADTNAELESFSYTVSHDLRAPLRHVLGFVRLLAEGAEGKLDADTAQYLPRIADAATRMGQLIDALLDFSRLGRAGLHQTEVRLDALIEERRAHLQPDLEGRAIEWKIGPLPVVQADPAMLRQVLANLIENAVKFTRAQPAAIIEITCESGPTEHVVHIRDNGAGFDPRYADKLFGVFQRLHSVKDFEGTGIGLATSRRIIHRHGGRIWAESQPGQGADFYFSLPKNGQITAITP